MNGTPATAAAGGSLQQQNCWQVYIILCTDNSLYTGITTDIDRRFHQHATGRGARYFRGRQPLQVVYREAGHSRSSAAVRELQIKTLSRADKVMLIAQHTPPAQH
jgi:putative endonuclease